jgi:hypothetical protein
MHDLYASRYVNGALEEVAAQLGPTHVAIGSLAVDTGVAMRFHDWMWLVPVIGHWRGRCVVRGHFRVMAVCGGRCPVTELLLVGNARSGLELDLDGVVDALVARLPAAA